MWFNDIGNRCIPNMKTCSIYHWNQNKNKNVTLSDKVWEISMSSLQCENISSHGQRRIVSFLKTAHWYGLNFLYLFIRPENLNLKFSENLATLTFLKEKVSTFAESKWYMYTLWLLITLCNMPEGFVT